MKKTTKIILIIAGVGALAYSVLFVVPSLMYYFGPNKDAFELIELEDGSKVTLEELEKLAQKEGVKNENLSETEDSFVEITKKTEGNAVIYTDKTSEIFDLGFEKVSLKVVGNKVYMNGVVSTSTPDFFKKVFAENPKIDTLIMEKVDGSADDDANLQLAKWIAKKGLTFILEKNSDIASGGTDFFLTGKTRIIHKGAKVGVHSWSEGEDGKTAKDYPRDSKVHQPYIDYYKAIGWSDTDAKKFYYFTIDSATAHGMHAMTEQEMIDYKITTEGRVVNTGYKDTQEKHRKDKKETGTIKSTNLVKVLTKADISTTIPKSLGKFYAKNFVKYTAVKAPNGKNIHIVAQDKISDEQILRARGILEHYLRDYAGSQYGADKTQVANKMADNNAILALLNGQDDGKNKVGNRVTGQPLYQNEMQTEGGSWYTNQNYEHRDAAYEEILHFVHDNGIGVDGNGEFRGALATYQAEIRKAQKNALAKNLWGRGTENKGWIQELAGENSLTQEYLASVIDSYYGLWGAWKDGKDGMWGIYTAKTRDDIASKDPIGYELLNNTFFHSYITYNARIEPSFEGTFSLRFDAKKPYTHHSQYLKDITLLGDKNTSVVVNELDNYITGNTGTNTVIFSGKSGEYKISQDGTMTIVEDTIEKRDGKNTLFSVEFMQFKDKKM